MVRNKKPTARVRHNDEEILRAVVKVVNQQMTIREAADNISMSKSTLARAVTKYRQSLKDTNIKITFQPNHGHQLVFTTEEELLLAQYIIDASKFHCGLTKNMVREFAFDYVKKLDRNYPSNWDKAGMAGR